MLEVFGFFLAWDGANGNVDEVGEAGDGMAVLELFSYQSV